MRGLPYRNRARDAHAAMSTFKIGKFHVVSTLGTGAHSTILQVRREADSKNYALKVVPINEPEDRKFLVQAEHEFRVAQMLDHPTLVKIHVLEPQKDWLFRVKKVHLLVELVNGKTLDQVPRLPFPQAVQVFERIAAALAHMHRRGVFHADMKPNNVMLSRSGDVKVIDYGLAWIKGEPKARVQGTPEYMAPEQASKQVVNERTDLYNLGATMYRLVTWRLPPPAVATEEGGIPLNAKTWEKLFKPVAEYAPQAPKPLVELIHKCLSFNPMKRPERAAEVQEELKTLADDLVRRPEDHLDMLEF